MPKSAAMKEPGPRSLKKFEGIEYRNLRALFRFSGPDDGVVVVIKRQSEFENGTVDLHIGDLIKSWSHNDTAIFEQTE